MMKYSISFVICIVLFSVTRGQQYVSGVYTPKNESVDYDSLAKFDSEAQCALTITGEEMKKHLYILASDEFGGRELGTEGNNKAAAYIADRFAELHLGKISNDSYFQEVAFTYTRWDGISFSINGDTQKHLRDFVSFPLQNRNLASLRSSEVLFVGYGIESDAYSDYKKLDVKGKTLLMYMGEPMDDYGVSQVSGSSELSEWSGNIQKKLELACKKGAELVLFIDDDVMARVAENRTNLLSAQMTLGEVAESNQANSMYIGTHVLESILGKKRNKFIKRRDNMRLKGKSKFLSLPANVKTDQIIDQKTILGKNIVGFVEGIDPEMKDEVIIVSAHYDHIGTRGDEINNGADDNGSGTTTIIELAQALNKAKEMGIGPRRSVCFILMTGEEKGLLGSYYYSENPLIPIKNTVANVNVDMVGRVHEKYQDDPHYIYVIGSDRLSSDLHHINEEVNDKYVNLTLDYIYNGENDPNRFYFRSDHYNFARKGIPSIFFFNGTHSDYHRPSDTADKINYTKMQSVARHIFHLISELANRDQRIRVDKN